jgi:hypothetical protein
MIGVAADVPGKSVAHFTLLVFENSLGRFCSVLEPLKFGPRQCPQFSACEAGIKTVRDRAEKYLFIQWRLSIAL